jgi:hypothetical protein
MERHSKQDSLPNAMFRLSPAGWIKSEMFLERFKFFISLNLAAPPVILLDAFAYIAHQSSGKYFS